MFPTGTELDLYLNDKCVGRVIVQGQKGPWYFGQFSPLGAFGEFAQLFGSWSLLMHADDESDRLSRETASELQQTENAIDGIHAQLKVSVTDQWRSVGQLNIDGPLVEWKEF